MIVFMVNNFIYASVFTVRYFLIKYNDYCNAYNMVLRKMF